MLALRNRTGRLRAADVIGVPVLPPPWATGVTTRIRAALAKAHRAMAPPPLQVLESLFGVLDHGALVALCEIGVPEALEGPTSSEVLAGRLGVDANALDRLLRFAVVRGWVRLDRRGRFSPTAVMRFLREDHPGRWRGWLDFMAGAEVTAAVGMLGQAARRGGDAFEAANGAPFFDWMKKNHLRSSTFDAAMGAGAQMHALALSTAIDWSTTSRVCDVGGGDGSLLATLVGAQPHVRGTLFELPEVAERARASLPPTIEVVGGDAFAGVPSGADSYLLVNVVHDWSDADVVRLLRRVGDAAPAEARIIVVEGVRRARPVDDITTRTDILMLSLAPGGRERTVEEVSSLAHASGLNVQATVSLATGDVAHVLVRSSFWTSDAL